MSPFLHTWACTKRVDQLSLVCSEKWSYTTCSEGCAVAETLYIRETMHLALNL